MSLYIVPIEPLTERYTESWYRNIPVIFKSCGSITSSDEVVVIDGTPLLDFVKVGTFLDINSTVHYKSTQLQRISKMFFEGTVQDGDIFFFSDIEFWGLESVRLLAQMNNKRVGIYGFLHAASYTKGDAFEVSSYYQKFTELGWVHACDGIFVGSEYSKEAFLTRRAYNQIELSEAESIAKKIHVTGNPIFVSDYPTFSGVTKRKKLILPNRFDIEKYPHLSLNIAQVLKARHPDLEIVVTTSRPKFTSNRSWLVDYARLLESTGVISIYEGLSKYEYHKHLAESAVMLTTSPEESFGYCVVEALMYDTPVVAHNSCSHPELLGGDRNLLFNDIEEIPGMIDRLLADPYPVRHLLGSRLEESSLFKMHRIMSEFNNG